jgi:hypothetical protein
VYNRIRNIKITQFPRREKQMMSLKERAIQLASKGYVSFKPSEVKEMNKVKTVVENKLRAKFNNPGIIVKEHKMLGEVQLQVWTPTKSGKKLVQFIR